MAGVKGRSGGARSGAGRKPSPPPPAVEAEADSLAFLQKVFSDEAQPLAQRVRAAIAHAQYIHVKRAQGGKKKEQAEKADKAAGGRFQAAKPPLKLVGSR